MSASITKEKINNIEEKINNIEEKINSIEEIHVSKPKNNIKKLEKIAEKNYIVQTDGLPVEHSYYHYTQALK